MIHSDRELSIVWPALYFNACAYLFAVIVLQVH